MWVKDVFVRFERLCGVVELLQFACEKVCSGDGQRGTATNYQYRSMSGVTYIYDAGVGPFVHFNLFDDVEVEVWYLGHGVEEWLASLRRRILSEGELLVLSGRSLRRRAMLSLGRRCRA